MKLRILNLLSLVALVLLAVSCSPQQQPEAKTTPTQNAGDPVTEPIGEGLQRIPVDAKTTILIRAGISNENELTLSFDNAPENVRPLPMKPKQREPILNRSVWVVMACATWSQNDLADMPEAIRAAKLLNPRASFGIRLFDDYEEIKSWFPEYPNSFGSPLWVILRDGKVVEWREGCMKRDEIVDFVQKAIK
jgi:hypothetical protein